VEPDITRAGNSLELDLEVVEAAFTEVWARWERSLEELGGSVSASQLRAVLAIDVSGAAPVPRLAGALGMSSSGAARLCDQLEGAGLGAWKLDGGSGQESALAITPAGQRLASWVRDQRRADLTRGLESMSPQDRQALIRGLGELAAALS
jgi:DNA-binding MarR family transcriptional regulator